MYAVLSCRVKRAEDAQTDFADEALLARREVGRIHSGGLSKRVEDRVAMRVTSIPEPGRRSSQGHAGEEEEEEGRTYVTIAVVVTVVTLAMAVPFQ